MELEGKVALVTGGSRGIGRAIALAVAERGGHVVVNYVRHPEAAEEVVERIRSMGRRAMAVRADVANSEEVDDMVRATVSELGGVDILVNNAGYYERGNIFDITEERWDRMIDVHLKGTFLCTKAVVPHMVERRYGRIIVITSVGGVMALTDLHYCVAKGAQITFTKSLARSLAPYGITVNAVAPGIIITDLGSDHILTEEEKARKAERWREKGTIPLGRAGFPEDVAEAVLFLISHDYITGEVINVTGGWATLQR
ncbi:MAG: beta-ketoacyl-ACP reductase [Candidatus Latescibacterota bacterium]|nr:MAG: beta-ketoacyl-ACP reductase [Candidatus Latescibacterota bacterium]